MNTVFKIINDAIAKPFFREHAGIFIFFTFILFGIYRSFNDVIHFHYYIIHNILINPVYFFATCVAWLLYATRIIFYFYTYSEKDSYVFLQYLTAIRTRKLVWLLFKLQALLFTPALLYGAVILYVAYKDKNFSGGVFVLLALVSISSLITYSFYLSLQKTKQFSGGIKKFIPKVELPKNLFGFVLRFMFREQFIAIAGIKTLSFCCIYFFITLNGSFYEDRILWFFLTSLLAGHIILIYKNHHFIETQLTFYRNMPIPLIITIVQLFAVYSVILIPELWALKGVIAIQKDLPGFIIMAFTGPSLLLLIHSLLYTEDLKMEEVLKMLFGVWVFCFFLGLSDFRLLVPVICCITAVLIFYTSYYSYEKKAGIERLE
jgi:hypothetical protein